MGLVPALHELYMCARPQRVWFSAGLVINRVWFLHSSLELGMFFLGEVTIPSLVIRPSIKAFINYC